MKLLKLPGMRLGKLQTVGESSIDICKDITEIAPEIVKLNASFAAFKTGMLKGKASAEKKRNLDLKRDQIVSGFMNVVFEEDNFPNEDELILKAHEDLLKIVNKYGVKIARFSRARETASIDNLLADIAKMDITPLAVTGIPRWIPAMEVANEEFRAAAKEYISDSTDAGATKSASSLAPALEEDLEDMYAMLYATIKRTPSDALKKAYGDLKTLINSMK